MVYSNRSELDLSDENIRIKKNSISVESYEEKTAGNCYVADCVNILRSYL